MKKFLILLFAMETVIGISTGNQFGDGPKGNVAHASNKFINVGELDNNSAAAIKGDTERFKAEFAYEMAQITAKIVSAPATNIENFKVEFAYATAKVTAKVMPIIPISQRNNFAYEMAQITAKIVSDQNLNIEKAKAEFAYKIAQLTAKIITNSDKMVTGKINNTGTDPQTLLRNNADIELKAATGMNNDNTALKATANPGYIAPETYTGLIDELKHVGDRGKRSGHKVNIDGEIRFHYALNSGAGQLGEDSSGIRAYLGFDTEINKDWRAFGMLEGHKNIVNYNNEFKLARLYVSGKSGTSMVKAGSFGYLMADGNIYDSSFDGIRVDFSGPLKYTVSLGKTDSTQDTTIVTVRYEDFNYNLEAGAYHYQSVDIGSGQNTIWTLGGKYNFSNFNVGAMVLGTSQKDEQGARNGYVFSFNYGDLKTWRPGTYGIFAKYYNQPRYTYIAHGMNGIGGLMQGFKGYGLGMNYALAPNFVAGIEYYGLSDKISGEKGRTWWSQLTHYF